MGIISNILGLGYLLASDVYSEIQAQSVYQDNTIRRKLPDLIDLSELPIWNDLFDCDLKKSPDEQWIEKERGFDRNEPVRNFEKKLSLNAPFSYIDKVEVSVIGNRRTNFKFSGKYSRAATIDLYCLVESEVMQRVDINPQIAAKETEGRFDTIAFSICWEAEQSPKFYTELYRNTDRIELYVETPFYNQEFLDGIEGDTDTTQHAD